MQRYIAYTDGSCIKNGKSGGWATIILDDKENIVAKLYNGYKNTTNNRQEIIAVLETLKYFKEPTEIIIYCDSKYVVDSINNGHIQKWFESNDFSKKNLDLWFQILDLLSFHKLTMFWVKGHTDNKWNNMADFLATHAATFLNLEEDIWTFKSV